MSLFVRRSVVHSSKSTDSCHGREIVLVVPAHWTNIRRGSGNGSGGRYESGRRRGGLSGRWRVGRVGWSDGGGGRVWLSGVGEGRSSTWRRGERRRVLGGRIVGFEGCRGCDFLCLVLSTAEEEEECDECQESDHSGDHTPCDRADVALARALLLSFVAQPVTDTSSFFRLRRRGRRVGRTRAGATAREAQAGPRVASARLRACTWSCCRGEGRRGGSGVIRASRCSEAVDINVDC